MLSSFQYYARLFFHLGCHYLVWFACVLTAAKGYVWLGFIIALGVSAMQYLIEAKLKQTNNLLFFMISITIIGFLLDSFQSTVNIIRFHANPFPDYWAPPWIIGLWLNFSIILFTCLKRFFLRYQLFAALCFIGFPIAFYAGIKLGAASLPIGYIGLFFIGLSWSIVLPTVLYYFTKLTEEQNV